MTDAKRKIRASLREQRRQLSRREQQQAGRHLAAQLCRQSFFRHARRIAFYLPNDGELDPGFALDIAAAAGKQTYLPVLDPLGGKTLKFARWQPGDKLIANRFGIAEPSLKTATFAAPWTLDVVCVPLVAFDGSGNRLGMGGGFYDRTFASCYHGRRKRPLPVGLAPYFQQQSNLPADPWDVAMHAVATDLGVIVFSGTASSTRDHP